MMTMAVAATATTIVEKATAIEKAIANYSSLGEEHITVAAAAAAVAERVATARTVAEALLARARCENE